MAMVTYIPVLTSVFLAVIVQCQIQGRRPATPTALDDADYDPIKAMRNELTQTSPDGKQEFMKVALRKTISKRICKLPAAYKNQILWDCHRGMCPIELQEGQTTPPGSQEVNGQVWDRCKSLPQQQSFWDKNKEEYLSWAKSQDFYKVDQIYYSDSYIYLPVADRKAVESDGGKRCVLPGVGFGSRSNATITDCQEYHGVYKCQVLDIQDQSESAVRSKTSGQYVERLVWRECDKSFHSNNDSSTQKEQALDTSDQQTVSEGKYKSEPLFRNQSQVQSQGEFSLWWIVLIVSTVAICGVAIVWLQHKYSNRQSKHDQHIDELQDETTNLVISSKTTNQLSARQIDDTGEKVQDVQSSLDQEFELQRLN
eukprot:TRINITY_DN4110_c0_g1_i2.p3 TRINITY_DN4110_c0_g1~~TRINITY_DN4110_c0_g1_i2.p3  ORF type:complete len:394 (-),score=38.11 TRINITY_DN4110_c0_g1_i2:1597-2700(-)